MYTVEQDTALCDHISDIADLLCSLFMCPGESGRGFDTALGKAAYVPTSGGSRCRF